MTDRLLIIDKEADEHRVRLLAALPGLEIDAVPTPAEAVGAIGDATALFAFASGLNDALVAQARRLEWLQFLSSGTDALLRLPSLGRDVVVTSCHGIHGPPVSEMVLLHMLALARDVPRLMRHKQTARWEKFSQPLLNGKTVAIIGTGIIGRALAGRCKALGMTVVGVSASPRALPDFDWLVARDALAEAAADADFLVLLTPLSDATRGIVDARIMAAMKPSAFLINLGRGGLCDEDALLAALREKRLAGAGLDVFATEPLPPDHPFWRMDNVFITSHMGGESDSYPALAIPILRTNVACFLDRRWDRMVNRVTRR